MLNKVLPFILLASDNYATLTYLEYLKKEGFCFKKIIYVNKSNQVSIFKKNENKDLVNRLQDNFSLRINYDIDFIDYSEYSSDIETVKVNSDYDDNLLKVVKKYSSEVFFFSYRGRVPRPFLDVARFIHIHPGIMPNIRGSDGLFWSLLERGKAGATMFFLDEGIDDGEIIFQSEYLINDIQIDLNKYTTSEIYRGILNYFDPYIRAKVFVEAIKQKNDLLQTLNSYEKVEGRQFFTMHTLLLEKVIKTYFGEINE